MTANAIKLISQRRGRLFLYSNLYLFRKIRFRVGPPECHAIERAALAGGLVISGSAYSDSQK